VANQSPRPVPDKTRRPIGPGESELGVGVSERDDPLQVLLVYRGVESAGEGVWARRGSNISEFRNQLVL
jgi:hypothetical protein